jgi:ferric-dicitrate binding protein FerR (iron transport regulator)
MSREEGLIRRHLDEIATPEERAELEKLLAEKPEVAALFARLSRQDGAFHRHFHEERAASSVARQLRSSRRRRWLWIAGAAAGLIGALFLPLLLRSWDALATLHAPSAGVRVEREGEPLRIADGLLLRAGDRILTPPGGAATIRLAGQPTRFDLRAGSELLLGAPSPGPRLELRAGSIDAAVAPQPPGAPLVVTTPHGEAKVLGTRFVLSVGGEATTLEVTEGRVLLTRGSDGDSAEVGALQTAVASKDGGRMAARPSIAAYRERFMALWKDLTDPKNGYFSPQGLPYHSAETLIVDAPDHGHLSTSETFSYWVWLQAAYGRFSGQWNPLFQAVGQMERALIPAVAEQPTAAAYDPKRPATPTVEVSKPSDYPVALTPGIPVGEDLLAGELRSTYGEAWLQGMHWLVDLDNWYGFGRRGDRVSPGGLLNTFQRGPEESVWETIPHPSWEDFRSGGPNGFLDLFIREASYARQWRYTCAPDADARAIQALYWASTWAPSAAVARPVDLARKMGDSLRYALRDRHFRREPHYLVGWSYAWGGSIDEKNAWAWRSGSDQAHLGYQNPVAAWVLSQTPAFRSLSPNGAAEWARSLDRQLEFYRWLQSEEGALGGGAKVGGNEFHGMTYDPHPVFLDPPSNEWFGWQAWAMDRLAQYLLLTDDPRARPVCDKWVAWIKKVVKLNADGTYAIPATLQWTGRPGNLRVAVTGETADVGVTGALARALVYHAAATKDEAAQTLARELLDRIWTLYRDEKGVSNPEPRTDYRRFHEKVHIPEGWKGPHKPGSTFLDLRPKYKQDPDWPRVETALAKGEAPVFRYHRFWAQVEVALANAEYARLFK